MVRNATAHDLPLLAQMACRLWPNHTPEEMRSEIEKILTKPEAAFFLAFENDTPTGFAQCQLRHDYVEGTQTSPVGYLEGIYVDETHRRKGVARQLLAACQNWARAQGAGEFASDCELDNQESLLFHQKLGFEEANRVICFVKKL